MSPMNSLWSLQPTQQSNEVSIFFEQLDWKVVKGKTYHIFSFAYGLQDQLLQLGHEPMFPGKRLLDFGHWSLFVELKRFIHFNSWTLSRKETKVELFFRTLEVDLQEIWDNKGHALILNLPWMKPLIRKRQGVKKYHECPI